ncbi:SLC13 family permease [Alkalihalobacillus sp. R86527]|uniref:SLC13 family permease n=1 Tax=Alkalihalobacillus sp. R86527 TaxID=3093863 RepID=UPI003672A74B
MLVSLWNKLWLEHGRAKELLTFASSNTTGIPSTSKEKNIEGYTSGKKPEFDKRKTIGLLLGPALFSCILLFFHPSGLTGEALAILASTAWIATWWITEAIPIPATSLLPLILFPLTGGLEGGMTASAYGDNTIFLFMGGFLIALSMQKWNLHKRVALIIISAIGTSTEKIVLGFMAATGFLSMWISNTATSMMMVPIGMAVIYQVSDQLNLGDEQIKTFPFGKAVMLGIAYSASIGGLATLIGTPPNTFFAAIVNELYGIEISFARWMLFGVPIVLVLLVGCWYYLVKLAFPMQLKELPGGKQVITKQRKELGTMSSEEKIVMAVFTLTAFAWISRSFILSDLNPNINDTVIAMSAAILLFILPSPTKKGSYLLDWETAKGLPWGILLLFGAGLAIAAGFQESGLAKWIGEQLTVLEGVHLFVILLAVTALVIFLTEITSNTATATMMFPIMASLSAAISVHPYALMIGAGVAASCAFMLPVATPPNAVVFGSGYLKIPDMAKAGFWLNITSIIIISIAVYFYMPLVWGINLTEFPSQLK